jgi:4-hydroxybenzoate polyprenyltransferase
MGLHATRELLLCFGWPALASVSLAMAVGRGDPDPAGIALLACGTATAYGLDRWVDHRESGNTSFRTALLVITLLIALIGGVLAISSWWRFQICIVLGLISGAYVPLKKVIPKNILTTVAWTVGCCTLPFATAPNLHHAYWGSVICVFCIMVANTVFCDIPDREEDRQAGVKGITSRFGAQAGIKLVLTASTLGIFAGGITGHLPLAVTAACFGPLAVLQQQKPHRKDLRKWADLFVTFVPGLLSLLV